MEYRYKVGLVVGRFQPFHNGHKSIIDRALNLCEVVLIGIGSAQESRTDKNPFDFYERRNRIFNSYSEQDQYRLRFMPLVNIGAGDSPIWGTYVMNSAKFALMGQVPEIYCTGSETDRNNWMKNYPDVFSIVVDRNDIPISGTELRELISEGAYEEANSYLPIPLSDSDKEIIKEVCKSDNSSI